jgi:hypothetical protein
MKKLFTLLFILVSFNGLIFSQTAPKYNLTKDGVEPVVLNFDASFTANQLYTKVKEWVKLTNGSSKTLRIDKENSLVKVGIFKEKAWKIRDHNQDYWYDMEYTLNIEIKDAKCRVTFATPDVRWKLWFNKDGSTIKKFKDSEASFETTINEPLTSLYQYIKEPKKVVKDDW